MPVTEMWVGSREREYEGEGKIETERKRKRKKSLGFMVEIRCPDQRFIISVLLTLLESWKS